MGRGTIGGVGRRCEGRCRSPRFRAAAVIAMITASSASALQPPTEAQVRAWLEREIEASKAFPSLGDVGIRWRAERLSTLTPDELRALREAVQAAHDHPRAWEVVWADREREVGPHEMRWTAFLTEGRWRTWFDTTTSAFSSDRCIAGDRVWSRTGENLTIYTREDVENPDIEGGAVPRADENVFVPLVSLLLDGGLHKLSRVFEVRVDRVSLNGDRWEAIVVKDPPVAFDVRYEGRWDATAGRGRIERRTVVNNGYSPEGTGSFETFSEWKLIEPLGRWVCGRVDRFKPGGRRWERVVFEGVVPMPEGGWDAITRIPDGATPDPIRGEVRFVNVMERRIGKVLRAGEDGGPAVIGEIPATRRGDRHAWLRPVGWAILGVAVVMFIVVRIVRSK